MSAIATGIKGVSMLQTIVIVAIAAILVPVRVAGQTAGSLQAQAQIEIRGGRPADAVALLDKAVKEDTADSVTRLVYVVALIADGRVDAAEVQIARLGKGALATPAQLDALQASLNRIKTAKAITSRIAPLIERGDVRAALKALDGSASDEPGNVFARAYLFRLLGEFPSATETLSQARLGASGMVALDFSSALGTVKDQQAAFEAAKARFERLALENFTFRNNRGCGVVVQNVEQERACTRELINSASKAAETLFELAPFSEFAMSARLTQAIWMGKDVDAIEIVRQSRRNHPALAIPSMIYASSGDWSHGNTIFHFDSKDIELVDLQVSKEIVDLHKARHGYYPPSRFQSSNVKKSDIPSNLTRVPFSMVQEFSQQLEILDGPGRNGEHLFGVRKSVELKTSVGALGGVPHTTDFAEVFGEIPLRLALRTYGKVVAECLSLPQGKYSLVSESPKRGGLMMGMANLAVAGLAASQGNAAAMSEASQAGTAQFLARAEALDRDASAKLTWQQEMGNVRLAVDSRAVQSEVASLLDGSLIAATERAAAQDSLSSDSAPSPARPVLTPDARSWIERLQGTWRSQPVERQFKSGASQKDASWTLVLEPTRTGLFGTLRTDSTYTRPDESFRIETVVELNVDVNGLLPIATLVTGHLSEEGEVMPGVGFRLTEFKIDKDEVHLRFEYGLIDLRTIGLSSTYTR